VESTIKRRGSVWALNPSNDNFLKEDAQMDLTFHGPAIRAGISLPFAQIFAFTLNISALYIIGSGEIDIDKEEYLASDFRNSTTSSMRLEIDYNGFGLNAEPAIVCFIRENLILILGFRYQFIRLEGDLDIPAFGEFSLDDMDDHLYGGYLTILYKL
jgi:hypothetical protein